MSAVAATSDHTTLPTVAVPAVQLSAGSSQDMDQAFLNLLQLIGPDADNLVSGTVQFPELVPVDGTGFDGLDAANLPPSLGDDLNNFTPPTSLWRDVFERG